MNKKMREILAKINSLTAQAREKQNSGDTAGATEILSQIDELKSEYEVEKRLYEAERDEIPAEPQPKDTKANGFVAMVKAALRRPLSAAENALISGTGAESGENFLVPEDVDTTIRELRQTYVSAKEYTTVIPTKSLTGSFVYEKGGTCELTDFEDGSEISTADNPTFEQKKWAIKFLGKIIPVSRILLGAEQAGLTAYLNRWFVKGAITSENKKIFAALKDKKEAKTYKGLIEMGSSINRDLDPSALIGGVIITNQNGFDIMDSEKDAVGYPILTKDLANPTIRRFKGLPIVVFPTKQLPDEEGGSPVFIGDTKAGIMFIDKTGLEFASSEHVFFKQNQLALRVIEGFDVFQADPDAYLYGTIKAADAE